jgi:cell division transport system permease protein
MTPVERALRGARNDLRLYALSVFSVAVAFVCLASAVLVVVNVRGVHERWANTGRLSVYLRPEATAEAAASLEQALAKTPGILKVRRLTQEQARRELGGQGGDPLLDALPLEAFTASLELELEPNLARTRVDKLKAQLGALPPVESIQSYEAWSERLGALLRGGVSAALLLAAVVFAAVVSVVSSTIRLSLERRRLEVEVLKLVGATDGYVRRPFLFEGAAQGAIGALLAVALLGLLFAVVWVQMDPALFTLLGIQPLFLPWFVALALIVLGALLGASSARFSLRRLLRS